MCLCVIKSSLIMCYPSSGGGGYQSMGRSSYDQGGYMNTSGVGQGGGPSVSQSPGVGRKGGSRNQSIRPVTSAQIYSAEPPQGENPFRIDGEDVCNCTCTLLSHPCYEGMVWEITYYILVHACKTISVEFQVLLPHCLGYV